MPFPFVVSTTSNISFHLNVTSTTHPSFPSTTSAQRAILRAALKSHKRLSPSDQATNLNSLTSTAHNYLRYLLALDQALSGRPIAGEDVDVALVKEIEVGWRPTLIS